jgi:flavin-binding protein dodecin
MSIIPIVMRKLLENRIINQGGNGMVVKVIELVGTSSHNWTDAVDNAVMEASRSIDDILGVEVTNFTANIDNGHIAEYRADVKVAFKVNH